MRTVLFLASLVCLSWARTLLVQTKDEATTTTKPVAQIEELFEPPISIYSEYEDYAHLYEDSDHAPEEPSNGKSRKEGKGTNRKNRTGADCGNLCKVLF